MRNPWIELPRRPPYWLPEDRPHIEAFNRGVPSRYRLAAKLLPEPFLGPHGAPLVILMLNPGLVRADYALHRSGFARLLRANLGDNPEGHRHLGPRSEFTERLPWWGQHFAKVIAAGHDPDELSRKVLSVEFHGYHARSYRSIPVTLPSQRFGFQLVEKAMARGRPSFPPAANESGRSQYRLRDYRGLVPARNPRSAYISPGNLGQAGFKRVLSALE
jgi:hypothetical protein